MSRYHMVLYRRSDASGALSPQTLIPFETPPPPPPIVPAGVPFRMSPDPIRWECQSSPLGLLTKPFVERWKTKRALVYIRAVGQARRACIIEVCHRH